MAEGTVRPPRGSGGDRWDGFPTGVWTIGKFLGKLSVIRTLISLALLGHKSPWLCYDMKAPGSAGI